MTKIRMSEIVRHYYFGFLTMGRISNRVVGCNCKICEFKELYRVKR